MNSLLKIVSLKQIVQVSNKRNTHICNPISLVVLEANNNLSIAVDLNGQIATIGSDQEVNQTHPDILSERVINASGKCVVPGFIDAHTHPVWAGDRVHEFAMKLAGATYLEVHAKGGGINFTVRHTNQASEDELLSLFLNRLDQMLRSGTTHVECKSGYGLSLDGELKMLRVIEKAREKHVVQLCSTYCGAHAVSERSTSELATRDIIENHIPRIAELNKSGTLIVENCDVFCEKGVFDVDQSERILRAGAAAGLSANFHADELSPLGGSGLGARIAARSVSHLEHISDTDIAALAAARTAAVVLPTTAYILRLKPAPPVRSMLEAGVIVALGSDFNPNAHCLSMPIVMHLACVNLHMTMEEALAAATLNAAYSLNRSATHGSIEVGKRADLVLLDAPSWQHVIYQFGGDVVDKVVIGGRVSYEKKS